VVSLALMVMAGRRARIVGLMTARTAGIVGNQWRMD